MTIFPSPPDDFALVDAAVVSFFSIAFFATPGCDFLAAPFFFGGIVRTKFLGKSGEHSFMTSARQIVS